MYNPAVPQAYEPVLAVDEPLYEVVMGGEVLGRSPLTGRAPGMAMANGRAVKPGNSW
jgi:hypothetical protein